MRDPARIPEFTDSLRRLWSKYPDMRFWQLVKLLSVHLDSEDPYYIEDERSLEVIKELVGDETRD